MIKVSGPLLYSEQESGGYQLREDWWVESPLLIGYAAEDNDHKISIRDGRLTIKAGFECDGGSFPFVNSPTREQGFFAHDCIYRLCRQRRLVPVEEWRKKGDQLMYALHINSGENLLLAKLMYAGVRVGSSKHAQPQKSKENVIKFGR